MSVAFSPDGKTIVSGSADNTLKVWEVEEALPVPADADLPELKRLAIARGYTFAEVKKNSGDKLRILLNKGATLVISNRDHQSVGCRYPSLPDTSPSPNLSAPTLAAASLELKAEKQGAHSRDVNSVAFSPDGKTIVSGSDDKTLKVWDAGVSAPTPSNP